MSYDIHLSIPENSAEGKAIASLIEHEHVSPQDAVQRLMRGAIEAGWSSGELASQGSKPAASDLVREALWKVEQVRAERASELAALSGRNESAAQLIGFLKDEPDVVEAIREASRERRQAMYS